ncbi:MAG: cupin domain-containing protein [Solirubrobacteraceae bacterium]
MSRDKLEPTVIGEYEGRQVDAGDMLIAFESMPAEFPPDESPFKGLPEDRCQCDHWGYLFQGSFRVTYTDGPDEIVRAGDAYHLRPGHFVQTLEPVELIEISPVEEHERTMSTVARNMGLVTS